MPEFDHDRIAALAEGRLAPEDAAVLERAIAADPRASAELAAHRRALAATRSAPAALLSDDERSRIRLAVATAIGMAPGATAAANARRVPWAAISIAAASLAALVAVVPLAGLLTGGGDDSAVTIGLTEADDQARFTEDSGPAAPMAGVDATTAAESDGAGEGDMVSTTAAAGEPAMADEGALKALEDWLAEFEQEGFSYEDDGTVFEPTEDTACVTDARALLAPDGAAIFAAERVLGDRQAIIFFTTADDAVAAAAAYSPTDCALLASLP